MRVLIRAAVLVFVFLDSDGATFAKPVDWQPPPEGVVRDRHAAIIIAHAVWASMNPGLHISGEQSWEAGMNVKLINDVWKVSTRISKDEEGGTLIIGISKRDGRVVGIYLTQ